MNRKKWLGTAFIIVIIILSALSLITMASLSFPKGQNEHGKSYYYLARQAIWLFIGGLGFLLTANLNYKKYKDIIKYLYVLGIFALIMVLLIGKTSKGAKRWITLGSFAFQPSEFVKVILIITLATLVYNLKYGIKNRDRIKRLPWMSSIAIMGLTGIYSVLIILEKSFSNTAQIVIIGIIYLFAAEIKFSIISFFTVIIGISGWLGITTVGYRASRLASYMGENLGFHTYHSLIAIGSGQFSGRFYGNGLQKYGFLPEIHTDYIFSGYAEENGFLGVLLLLGLYAALLIIIGIALLKIKDAYAKYLLIGIFIMFATQVIGNVAVVSNVIPSTGIPLPMMSYGGSTTIVIMMTLGIVYNIIRALYKQEMGKNLDEMNEIDYKV